MAKQPAGKSSPSRKRARPGASARTKKTLPTRTSSKPSRKPPKKTAAAAAYPIIKPDTNRAMLVDALAHAYGMILTKSPFAGMSGPVEYISVFSKCSFIPDGTFADLRTTPGGPLRQRRFSQLIGERLKVLESLTALKPVEAYDPCATLLDVYRLYYP